MSEGGFQVAEDEYPMPGRVPCLVGLE
jgi:hypothetical protein